MAWNKADLRPRVETRAAALGKSVTDVLPEGYAFFAASKTGSPRIATLETIAGNLGWTLCELICGTATPPMGVAPALLKMAVTVAVRAVPSDRAETVADAAVAALDMLQAYEQDREPIDDRARAHIERSLRALYKDR
jgi:hypothetical protein